MTTLDAESLNQAIKEQSTLLKNLREQSAEQSLIDEAHKKLGDLKRSLGQIAAAGKERAKGGGEKKAAERLLLKTAKGTQDYGPAETACRSHIESAIKDVFTSYGGTGLDTPVFERKDILAGKYGEDEKLIFDLADQGGEQLALRYDHTVPLARHLASSLPSAASSSSKLFQFGKVYRRDRPVISKGRMREFSQADFDITGVWDTMVPDAEILSLLASVLKRIDVGEFTIKLNHRKILDGLFQVCGVPDDKIRSISSAVDKLDKLPWDVVRKEMTEEKGLDSSVADKIGEYVKLKGGVDLLRALEANDVLMGNANSKEGISEMGILFRLLDAYGVTKYISFDLSLARGLDYYTGIIYEAIVEASAPPASTGDPPVPPTAPVAPSKTKSAPKPQVDEEGEPEVDESSVGVGSIAAGGRYDNLVQLFTSAAAGDTKAGKKAPGLPCVGVSIGIDRVFALLWPKWIERGGRSKETIAYVMAPGDGLLEERIKLVSELREAGIKSDYLFKNKPKISAQFTASEKDEVPFAIILGGEELKAGLVTVKEQRWELVDGKRVKVMNEGQGDKVKRDELIAWINART
ncbi:histidine-tRNA ligase [Hysterangium stoloniferum]|nr:histidine-tRNA ligase [Hysterangium stoloniferum]